MTFDAVQEEESNELLACDQSVAPNHEMRPESGVNLVSGALQSSLARAQKNSKFHANNFQGKSKGVLLKGKLVNKGLSAYCESIGSRFATYTSDQFLELGKSLEFEDGGFLERKIPDAIRKECVILRQQQNVDKAKKKLLSCDKAVKTKTSPVPEQPVSSGSPTPSRKKTKTVVYTNPSESSSTSTSTSTSDTLSKSTPDENEYKKYEKIIKKLQEQLEDKTAGKAKRKRLVRKLKRLEKLKGGSAPAENSISNSNGLEKGGESNKKSKNKVNTLAAAFSLTTTAAKKLSSTVVGSLKKLQSKMGPEKENKKNGETLTNGTSNSNSNLSLQLPEPKRILYPREKISLGWKHKRGPGAGFLNVGNTCYLNSSLQALFHIPAFVNWILNDEEHRRVCNGTRKSHSFSLWRFQLTLKL